jgi:hypothetical protein
MDLKMVLSLGFLCLMFAQALPAEVSGLKGTTTHRVSGGAAGSKPKEKVMRVTFAVAPIVDNKPAYERAVFVTSNDDGSYSVSLPAGKYWIGSPAKARGPESYMPGAVEVVEQVVVVQEQTWTDVNVLEVGYAP